LKISYLEPPVIFNSDKLSSKLLVGITVPISLEDATNPEGSGEMRAGEPREKVKG
jgi:hypothetical protein